MLVELAVSFESGAKQLPSRFSESETSALSGVPAQVPNGSLAIDTFGTEGCQLGTNNQRRWHCLPCEKKQQGFWAPPHQPRSKGRT